MKPSKPKRPAAKPSAKKIPSYSVTRFRREILQAAKDAAKHGMVEVRERGKVIGYLVKPSLHRALRRKVGGTISSKELKEAFGLE